MPFTKSRSIWLATLILWLLSSTTHADVLGSHAAKGVLNVTFTKPNQKPVRTVSSADEVWTFNADNTFSRGDVLTGRWKQKPGNVVEASYDRTAYATHLSNFWANLGVNVSNIRILKNKVLIQDVSNGLGISETLVYSMDVLENGRGKRTTVYINGFFVAPDGTSENPALREMFPTMWQDQAAVGASSSFSMSSVQIFADIQGPDSVTGNINTSSYSLVPPPDSVPTPQQ